LIIDIDIIIDYYAIIDAIIIDNIAITPLLTHFHYTID
jgi:hypothetical protein